MSHGVAALALGDDTAWRAGRVTLNPIPHIDPFGSVVLPLMGVLAQVPVIGWAKPVPIDPAQLRQPRRHMLFVSLAGPATNLSLMAVSAVIARALVPDFSFRSELFGYGQLAEPGLAERFLVAFAAVNLFLGVFNLLPIPPLDGSSIVERFLPANALPAWHRYRMYGFLVLFAVVFWTPVLERIVDPLLGRLLDFIYV